MNGQNLTQSSSRGRARGAWGSALTTAILVLSLLFVIVTVARRSGLKLPWNPYILRDFLTWNAIVALAAIAAARLASTRALQVLVGALAVYLLVGVGIAQGLSTLLFLCSSYVFGRVLIEGLLRDRSSLPLVAGSLAIGITSHLALFGILIHFKVNYRSTYLVILALPVLVGGIALLRSGERTGHLTRSLGRVLKRIDGLPLVPASIFLAVIGYVARFSFFPSLGYDDVLAHLRMWTILSTHSVHHFDPADTIWSVAPFAFDLLSSVVSIVAASDCRGAISLTLYALLLGQLWQLSAYVVRRKLDRGILLVLFATTPMVANLLTLQQVELLLALLAVSGILFALQRRRSGAGSRLASVLAVAALCAATKLPGAVLGVSLLAVYLLCLPAWRGGRTSLLATLPGQLVLLPVFAFAALHSYALAWRLTGNPLFPFYNAYFKSPVAPASNFVDTRWLSGFSLSSYWDVFFHASRHFETANDFNSGFQFLFILPLGLALLALKRYSAARLPLLLPLLGFGLAMFSATQYWRYMFPILPLASVAMGAVLSAFGAPVPTLPLMLRRGAFLGFAAINLAFLPSISGFFEVPAYRYYTEAGKEAVTRSMGPAKTLTEEVNRRFPGARVFYDSQALAGATLDGSPVYAIWHSPAREARVNAWRSTADVADFIRSEGIDLIVWDQQPPLERESRALLLAYLSQHGYPERQVGTKVLYRILDAEPSYRLAFRAEPRDPRDLPPAGFSLDPDARGDLLSVHGDARVIATIDIGRASVARYSATFRCPNGAGLFTAQINWNVGPPYIRLVRCNSEPVEFSEVVPIPLQARTGVVYVLLHEAPEALVSSLQIETN